MSKTEMILKALKMCWLPYAFLECGQPTPKSMELGRESDLAIERHRIEMRSVSGLPALDTVTIQAQHVLPTRLESLPPTSKQVSSPEQEEQEQQEPSGAMDLVLQKAEVVNWDAGDL